MPAVCLSCPGMHLPKKKERKKEKASLLHPCLWQEGQEGEAEVFNVTRQLTNKNLNKTKNSDKDDKGTQPSCQK